MKAILITGSSGLIGSQAVEHFDRQSHRVIGIDNNMRQQFFGPQGDATRNLDVGKGRLHTRLPTAAFEAGGTSDIVRDGATAGTLVPVGDVRALQNAIGCLLNDPERRACMAVESRRIAVQEYKLDIQARRYVAPYESAMQRRCPS